MNTEYYQKERLKSKNIVSNISNSLKQIQWKIDELDKSKRKTDSIIQKFGIECYKYNLVEDFTLAKDRLDRDIRLILNAINTNKIPLEDDSIEKSNYVNDILSSFEIQLKGIDSKQLDDIENMQLNAIKKGIYNKFMLTKSNIDREIIKAKFEKMQNRSYVMKWLDRFFDVEDEVDGRKENLFMQIQEIDRAREKFSDNSEPTKEYKIVDILADIELYLLDNRSNRKYKGELAQIKEIRNNINSTFSIDCSELKKLIIEKRQSRLPVRLSKNLSRLIKERQKAIEFLNKNGYVVGETKEEPIVEVKLTNTINRINSLSDGIEKILSI